MDLASFYRDFVMLYAERKLYYLKNPNFYKNSILNESKIVLKFVEKCTYFSSIYNYKCLSAVTGLFAGLEDHHGVPAPKPAQTPMQTKDDAYDAFMREMEGYLWRKKN